MHLFRQMIFVSLVVASSFFATGFRVATAQTDPCNGNIVGKTNSQLQADLEACNAEIAKWTDVLNSTKKNTASYATEVTKLNAKINAAQATIKSKTIAITNLNNNISKKQNEITDLETQIQNDIDHIAEIIRKTNQIDSYSVVESLFSEKDLSEFFIDVDTYAATRSALKTVLDNLRGVKTVTEEEKAKLAKERDLQAAAKAEIEANKKKVEVDQKTQKGLLTQSQNQEKAFASLVADKQAKAAAIRTALFGLRDSAAIPFGTALAYAQDAGAKTGVRPALILGILQQESNLGANVGTCVITDLSSGQTKSVNSGKIFNNGIHPTRDLPLLQTLLGALGRDPLVTKVSCPLSIGYGGAMGPAQFIPSTWNIMKSRIGTALGKETPDPWNPADAIMAMALFLKDLGAGSQTYTAERNAACRYYGGGSACNTRTTGYGNSVMSRATNIQNNMIDLLQDA